MDHAIMPSAFGPGFKCVLAAILLAMQHVQVVVRLNDKLLCLQQLYLM